MSDINKLVSLERKSTLNKDSLLPLSLALEESLFLLGELRLGKYSGLSLCLIRRQVMLCVASLCSIENHCSEEESMVPLLSFNDFPTGLRFEEFLRKVKGTSENGEKWLEALSETSSFLDDFFSEILLIQNITNSNLTGPSIRAELSRSLSHIAEHYHYAEDYLIEFF